MNILVPDSWLREFLQTKATPLQIKEYLSLCGPSVEKISGEVYEIEVTSNRPDCMSIYGIAREAAAILPRFGIAASLKKEQSLAKVPQTNKLKLIVKTDPKLNPRWTSIVFDNVSIKPSPDWLKKRLELVGVRSLNNVIDVTNYLLHAYGQPAHVFDYDQIKDRKMVLRESKKGEKITTLDGKNRLLPGGDIVIEDGSGKLIDLCGIMGGENSSVKGTTKRMILFLQTYNPVNIRKTMMSLSHRTEAGSLFEKNLDPELVWPVFFQGIKLMQQLSGGKIASRIIDLYPQPYKPYTVSASLDKIASYLGVKLTSAEIRKNLASLGFAVKFTNKQLEVKVPSFRRDVTIDVDVIEEIARIYGYHNLPSCLPASEPPQTVVDPLFKWEEEIKIRLRDWGFTELMTYSMISEVQMEEFGLDKQKAYKISNPLSKEWIYMRPSLRPSVLQAVKENLNHRENLKLFELSMIYQWMPGSLPNECPRLMVVWSGKKFLEAKGLTEALFNLFGLNILSLENYGSIEILDNLSLTILELDVAKMVAEAKPVKVYRPIPKYPPIIEDLSFQVPEQTLVGPLMQTLTQVDSLVSKVELLDNYENTRTFHITYQDPQRNLTNEEIKPIREKIIKAALSKFGATIKE